jgi:hypothetical protein
MKSFLVGVMAIIFGLSSVTFAAETKTQKGYTKKDGTAVKDYTKTKPDKWKSNNKDFKKF